MALTHTLFRVLGKNHGKPAIWQFYLNFSDLLLFWQSTCMLSRHGLSELPDKETRIVGH